MRRSELPFRILHVGCLHTAGATGSIPVPPTRNQGLSETALVQKRYGNLLCVSTSQVQLLPHHRHLPTPHGTPLRTAWCRLPAIPQHDRTLPRALVTSARSALAAPPRSGAARGPEPVAQALLALWSRAVRKRDLDALISTHETKPDRLSTACRRCFGAAGVRSVPRSKAWYATSALETTLLAVDIPRVHPRPHPGMAVDLYPCPRNFSLTRQLIRGYAN